ncbi:MAG: cyclophilin-like fold protein [Hominilimicola sp.]
MRKIISLYVCICMMLYVFSLTVCAAPTAVPQDDMTIVMEIDNPYMTVNERQEEIDPGNETSPVIINGRTMIPVRAVVEAIGGVVYWDSETHTVTLQYADSNIKLKIGNTDVFLNDELNSLDTAPVIINDRTLLPIRFIMESFGFKVKWKQSKQTVTITNSDDSSKNVLVVYYSSSGTTERVAKRLQEKTDGDIYEIRTKEKYLPSQARGDRENNRLPEIETDFPDFSDYDLILAGCPIWGYTVATTMMSFLSKTDFQGVEVAPFCTDIGKWGTFFEDFGRQAKNAVVLQGLSLTNAADVTEVEMNGKIDKWLDSLINPVVPDSYSVTMTIGENEYTASLDNSETSQRFVKTLPRVMNMTRQNDREYYGNTALKTENSTLSDFAENGDILYVPEKNQITVLFDKDKYLDALSDFSVIGKLSSNIDDFKDMPENIEVRMTLADENTNENGIIITAGGTRIEAEIYDNVTAQSFMNSLPLTVSLWHPAEIAKAFDLPKRLDNSLPTTREYEAGGLAYWHEGPSIAIFYNHNFDKTVVPVITIGKILNGQESFFENYSGEITITKK